MACSFAAGALVTAAAIQACIGSLLSTEGGTMNGPLVMGAPAQNTVRNGSLYIGNSDFFHTIFSTGGSQLALFNRVGSQPTDKDGIASYYLVNHMGGTASVVTNMHIGTEVQTSPAAGVWGFLSTLSSRSGGGNGGPTGHVAGYWQTVRTEVPVPEATITGQQGPSALRVDNVKDFGTGYEKGVGYPVSGAHPLGVTIGGARYEVVGVAPDARNATSGPGALTFREPLPMSVGHGSAGQTVKGLVVGANLWGGVIEYREFVDLPSSQSGFGQTLELDWVGNNADDANTRNLISAVLGKRLKTGADVELSTVFGVWPGDNMTPTSGGSIKSGFRVSVPFTEAVIDTRNAAQRGRANAIWLADGHRIAMDTSGQRYFSSDGGVLSYRTEAGAVFSLGNAGNAAFARPISVGGEQVIGPRQGGWSLPSGTVARGGLDASWSVQANNEREGVRAVVSQLQIVSRNLAALITDLAHHGLIGP